MVKKTEPLVNVSSPNYSSKLSRALAWYHAEIDKKEARGYIRNLVIQKHGRDILSIFDKISDKEINITMGWVARLVTNGSVLDTKHLSMLDEYTEKLLKTTNLVTVSPLVEKPSIQSRIKDKTKEHLGELEHQLDLVVTEQATVDLRQILLAKNIPAIYHENISVWIKRKASEFISVYESDDPYVKEAYGNLNKRKLTHTIKQLSAWLEALNTVSQHKKANRTPRKKKVKPPTVQVAKIKYLKVYETFNSVNPVELVGASQVWLYNTKYKKLSVYRTDSSQGIQVKGTTLQNYDPEQCEQKVIRNPIEVLTNVLQSGKVKLRTLLSSIKTKCTPVTGKVNEDTLILRVIK